MKSKRVVCILLVLLVVAFSIATLFACDKDKKPSDAQLRDMASADIRNAFINGLNAEWRGDFSDEAAAGLDDAGDYIVTLGWTELMCDVLKSSSLQTAKLQAMASSLKSENGVKLFENFAENAELLIPILREVGFTQADVSNIVYDLIFGVVDRANEVFDGMLERLSAVRKHATSDVTRNNIDTNRINVARAKAMLVPTSSEKASVLDAFEDAKGPLNALVSFAYNMSVTAVNDQLFNKIFEEGGALSDITDSEISLLLRRLLANVDSLKSALDNGGADRLDVALKLIIDKFDNDVVTSAVYSEIVRYAKYAYMVVDAIPAICDVIGATGNMLTQSDVISLIKEGIFANVSQSGDARNALYDMNVGLLGAKTVKSIMEAFDKATLFDLIDGITEDADYQKATPIMAMDLMLNISALLETESDAENLPTAHPDIITADDYSVMLNTIVYFNPNFDDFKRAYSDYSMGRKTRAQLEEAASKCRFGAFGVVNKYALVADATPEMIEMWYKYYVGEGFGQVKARIEECISHINQDMKKFVTEYYELESPCRAAVETLAAKDTVTEQTFGEDMYNEYLDLLKRGNLLGMVSIFILMLG